MAQRPGKTQAKKRRIADELRARIESGEYPVDEQMPTKPELAKEFGVAIGTIDGALKTLWDLGLAETRHGSGTFVLRQHPDEPETRELSELRARIAGLEQRTEDHPIRERVTALEEDVAELRQRIGRISAAAGQPRGGKREQANKAASDGRR